LAQKSAGNTPGIMVTLKPRHEQFVRQYIEGQRFGWSIGDCYQRAGFRSSGHSAEVNASRLLKKADIQARIAELGRAGEERARVTVASLLEDFDAVIHGASRRDQWGAVNRAMELRAKLKGFLVERLEVGPPGSFAECGTDDEIAAKVLDEMPLDQALKANDDLRDALLRVAGNRALPVT
jgi:hypothetical protein